MKSLFKASTLALATALLTPPSFADEGASKVVAADSIKWGYLNPLRGELSPGAPTFGVIAQPIPQQVC